jgi:hypothetical protein
MSKEIILLGTVLPYLYPTFLDRSKYLSEENFLKKFENLQNLTTVFFFIIHSFSKNKDEVNKVLGIVILGKSSFSHMRVRMRMLLDIKNKK